MELQSEQINELATALLQAQKSMDNATKDAKNPFFKNQYATLESVIDATKVPLADNGLVIIQTMLPDNIIVTTMLHTSGQWIRSYLSMTPTKNDPQGIGSAITYGRRYALAAICGITQVDDDGNDASTQPVGKPVEIKLKFNEFLAKVKAEINPTLTESVVKATLKDGGWSGYDPNDISKMMAYLAGKHPYDN